MRRSGTTPPSGKVTGAAFLLRVITRGHLGAAPPVLLRACCFVRAIRVEGMGKGQTMWAEVQSKIRVRERLMAVGAERRLWINKRKVHTGCLKFASARAQALSTRFASYPLHRHLHFICAPPVFVRSDRIWCHIAAQCSANGIGHPVGSSCQQGCQQVSTFC